MSARSEADDTTRLELAMARIARAARRPAALRGAAALATLGSAVPHGEDIAARLDELIADIRAVLRTDI